MALETLSFPERGGAVPEPSNATLEQAAQWYALLCSRQVTERDKNRWREWLGAAAEHRLAWRYGEDISGGFAPLLETPDPRLTADKLLRANRRFRQRRRALACVAGMAGAGALGWLAWRQELLPGRVLAWSADYRSGTGEQRDVVLADGTRIWLNTASAFNVDYTHAQRRIALVGGEIFIATAADANRPFVVDTSQGRLRALGTRFNVRQDDGQTWMAVYEGAVEIRAADTDATAVIDAGHQASFTREIVSPAIQADTACEAWTRGVLLAHDLTLREFVRELRRYRKGHIGLADEIADLRVYGNFPAQDTDRVLTMLTAALPVRIHQTLPWWVSIEPRP